MHGSKKHNFLAIQLFFASSVVLFSCSENSQNTWNTEVEDLDMQTVLNLSTSIRSVSTGGLWAYREREGWLRFVVTGGGVEHHHTRLYLQWFSQPDDSSEIEHLETVSVIELNGSLTNPPTMTRYTFGTPVCKDKTACTEATLKTFDIHEGVEKQFTLLFNDGPGIYRIEIK